jgi:hypothetical protein
MERLQFLQAILIVPLVEGDGTSEARAGGRARRNVAAGLSRTSTNGALDPPRALRAALSPSSRGTIKSKKSDHRRRATIHRNDRACDVARLIRRKEQRHRRDFIGPRETT